MNWRNIHIQNPYRFELHNFPESSSETLNENGRVKTDRTRRYTPKRKRSESNQLFPNISSSSLGKISNKSDSIGKETLSIKNGVKKTKRKQVLVPQGLIESLKEQVDKLLTFVKTSFSTYTKYIKNLQNILRLQVLRINKEMTQKISQISKSKIISMKQKDRNAELSLLYSQTVVKDVEIARLEFESPQESKNLSSLRSTIDSNFRFQLTKNIHNTKSDKSHSINVSCFQTENNKEFQEISINEKMQKNIRNDDKGRIGNIGIQQSLKKINFCMKSLASLLTQKAD